MFRSLSGRSFLGRLSTILGEKKKFWNNRENFFRDLSTNQKKSILQKKLVIRSVIGFNAFFCGSKPFGPFLKPLKSSQSHFISKGIFGKFGLIFLEFLNQRRFLKREKKKKKKNKNLIFSSKIIKKK